MADCQSETRKCLEVAFKEVDTDGSGFIDVAEVEKVLRAVYSAPTFQGKQADDAQIKKEAEEMIASMDQNNDKKVSLTEFINFFEKALACAH